MAILITNDDGIHAAGIAELATALHGLDDIVVAAPLENKSGVGSGITLGRTLTATRHPDGPNGEERYSVDGTPADAAKFGLQYLLKDKKPRLLASGINLGPNLGINLRCSGTVGASFEALIDGLPALAVSLEYVPEPDWSGARFYARKLAEMILALPADTEPAVYNLNVPSRPPEDIRGLVLAHQGRGGIYDMVSVSKDGDSLRLEPLWREVSSMSDCDHSAFADGYAVVTPLRVEVTHEPLLETLGKVWGKDVSRYRAAR